MDKLKLQILGGVPITANKEPQIVESLTTRGITSILRKCIQHLDDVVEATKNREDKTLYNDAASDLEDILVIVKSDKQKKAQKLFSELPQKIKKFISSKLDDVKSKQFDNYFHAIVEMEDDIVDGMEYEDNVSPVEADGPGLEDDMVQCPYCDCEDGVSKAGFYDHVMEYHVADSEEEMPSEEPTDEVEFDLGEIPGDDLTEEAVDATVWDKTKDKDESPNPYPKDDDKIKLPKNIKSALEKEIKELQKQVDELLVSDYNTADFYNNCANAMIEVLNHLKKETERDMKLAQIAILKFMSPIIQKFPADVYEFVIKGGLDTQLKTTNSLVSLFKDIKK